MGDERRRGIGSFYCIWPLGSPNYTPIRVGTATSALATGLTPGTTYEWIAFAENAAGVMEADGGFTSSFTTSLPGEFGKIGPPDGWTGQGTSPTLAWGTSVGATSYEYCYGWANDGACTPWTNVGANTSVSLSGSGPWTPNSWQVRAVNATGMTYANLGSWWGFGGVRVSAGLFHTCEVRGDGLLSCWGANSEGQATPPGGTFVQVDAAAEHTCAVRTDGSVACWGRDSAGQATPPPGTFKQISAGFRHTCGIEAIGRSPAGATTRAGRRRRRLGHSSR